MSAESRVGVALSGGGFRAASFHLGVLKRLEELRILERVELISTVSGGSITGALYALRCAQCGGRPGSSPVDSLIDEMRLLVTSNLRGQALLGDPPRALRTATSFAVPWVTRMPLVAASWIGGCSAAHAWPTCPPGSS